MRYRFGVQMVALALCLTLTTGCVGWFVRFAPVFRTSGRVTDQNGDPVPRAKVRFDYRFTGLHPLLLFEQYQPSGRRRTNGQGEFHITKWCNRIFLHPVEAPGYYYDPLWQPRTEFRRGEELPIRLWKRTGKAERLVIYRDHSVSIRIPINGPPLYFSVFEPREHIQPLPELPSGMPINGDLSFEAFLDKKESRRVWVRIRAVDGGVRLAPSHGFIAPEASYQDELLISYRYPQEQRLLFYAKSRGGQVVVRCEWYWSGLSSNKTEAKASLEYSANPQGGLNLEPWGGEYDRYYYPILAYTAYEASLTSAGVDIRGVQREIISEIEAMYMSQFKTRKGYHLGYRGNNGAFYAFVGDPSVGPHEGVPVVSEQSKFYTIARPTSVFYTPRSDYPMVFTSQRHSLLFFSGAESIRKDRWESRGLPIPPPTVDTKEHGLHNYIRAYAVIPREDR